MLETQAAEIVHDWGAGVTLHMQTGDPRGIALRLRRHGEILHQSLVPPRLLAALLAHLRQPEDRAVMVTAVIDAMLDADNAEEHQP